MPTKRNRPTPLPDDNARPQSASPKRRARSRSVSADARGHGYQEEEVATTLGEPEVLPPLPEDDAVAKRRKDLQAEFEALVPSMKQAPEHVPEDVLPRRRPIQLPFWNDGDRGVPNAVLRGALFPAIQGRSRKYFKRVRLKTQQDVEIHFTGMQLNQGDLDVWELCLHRAREHPLGSQCRFTLYSFLKGLGRTDGRHDYEWLRDSLDRLSSCTVHITYNDTTFSSSLVQGSLHRRNRNEYWLQLSPELVKLYKSGWWTSINYAERQQLRGKPLALWLHGYYSSHNRPYPIKPSTLRELSGSSTKNPTTFRANLAKALDAVRDVGGIVAWQYDGKLIHVKMPTRSQKHYLRELVTADRV